MERTKRVGKFAKIAVVVLLVVVVAAVGVGLAVLTSSVVEFYQDLGEQRARVAELSFNPGTPVDEQSFAGFDLSDIDDIKFNQIQTLITHNSYKKDITKLNYIALRPFTGVEGSHYEHDTLTNQLNNGVRGFELDIQYHGGDFWIYHIIVKDSRTHCPSWELALQELKLWSDNNPGHLPISLLIEIKPQNLSPSAMQKLDDSILDIMGIDKLITPALLMGDNKTLRNVAANNDWVGLSDVLGKFMFILHPHDQITDTYIASDPTLRSKIMVPMFKTDDYRRADPKYVDYFLLFKNDDLEVDKIRVFVNSGFMVRTRMDGPGDYQEGNQKLAVQTGAQIISTDFEPGVVYPIVDYKATLNDKTVILIGDIIGDR